jgi:hypothetical protein
MPDPRPTFDQRVFTALQRDIKAICADVPEVEGVALVVLWRLPDQRSVPSVLIQGATAEIAAPDQVLRMQEAALGLQRHLVDRGTMAVLHIRELAKNLAISARGFHEQRQEQEAAAAAQGQGQTVDTPHADADLHHDGAR